MFQTTGLKNRPYSPSSDSTPTSSKANNSPAAQKEEIAQGWERGTDPKTGQPGFIHTGSQHWQAEEPGPLLRGWTHAIHTQGELKGQLYYFNTSTRESRKASDRPQDTSGLHQFAPLLFAKNTDQTHVAPNVSSHPFGQSWGCERRSAAIHGSALGFTGKQDVEALCVRLLQAAQSNPTYKTMAAMEAFFVLAAFGVVAVMEADPVKKTVAALSTAAVGSTLFRPHSQVANEYSQVGQDCHDYLSERFGDRFVERLKKFELDKNGVNGVIALLHEYDPQITTLKLDSYLKKLERLDGSSRVYQMLSHLSESLYPLVNLDPPKA